MVPASTVTIKTDTATIDGSSGIEGDGVGLCSVGGCCVGKQDGVMNGVGLGEGVNVEIGEEVNVEFAVTLIDIGIKN